MKWVDFSYFKASLLMRSVVNDANQVDRFFVARSHSQEFIPAVKNAFISLGFKEDTDGSLIAQDDGVLPKRLFRLNKRVQLIEIDRQKLIDKPENWPIISTTNDIIGANNERSRNDARSNDALDGVSSEALSGDGQEQGAGDGSASSSGINEERNGYPEGAGYIRGGGMDGNQDIIPDNQAERSISELIERKEKTLGFIEYFNPNIAIQIRDSLSDQEWPLFINQFVQRLQGASQSVITIDNLFDNDFDRDVAFEALIVANEIKYSNLIIDEDSSDSDPSDFSISNEHHLGQGTRGEKIKQNLAAIRLVKLLDQENRQPTHEEKSVLVNFTGWGALKSVFNPNSRSKQDRDAYQELKQILTPVEMSWALNGVLAQHFTSKEVIDNMYKIIDHMGFRGGNIIEPTLGIGSFIGLMPESMRASSRWYGAEIDPIPGKIAQYLYPNASIVAGTGFQDIDYPYQKFDMVIGNPPFGDERITDINEVRSEISRFKIHNYILSKSSMHLKVDGIMPMIVTHRFLDAKDDEARSFLAKDFDLVTAIRLPNTAFKDNAGTEVTTDIVFFKRRDPSMEPGDTSWLKHDGLYGVDEQNREIRINQFFVDNPHLMLGTPSMDGTMYAGYGKENRAEFTLNDNGLSISEQINSLLKDQLSPIKNIIAHDGFARTAILINTNNLSIGGLALVNDVVYLRKEDDSQSNPVIIELSPETQWTEKAELGEKRFNRIKGMLTIRNKAYELIEAERQDRNNIEDIRSELNTLYDDFVDNFGYINDSANASLIDGDVRVEFALEKNYKASISSAKAKKRGGEAMSSIADKADILLKRVFYPDRETLFTSNVVDAYSICLSERGRLDFDFIKAITNMEDNAIIDGLSNIDKPLIYQDPETHEWLQEDEYLSGNVKAKLKEALTDPELYAKNIAGLQSVLPADVSKDDIFISIGQTWIPNHIYEQFLIELGVKNPKISISDYLGSVTVTNKPNVIPKEFSDPLVNNLITIPDMFNSVANKRNILIYEGEGEDRRVSQDKTREANIYAKKMSLMFNDWAFADEHRAAELCAIYNDTQNTTIERKFDGGHLKTTGSNPGISLRNSQKNAAWRMIQSNTILLDHLVGAGKTFTLVAGIMERKRLGLSKKPMLVVPNHLVIQWAKDFMALYPAANILAASEKDFASKNRKKLFGRIATNDFDAVIIGHSSLKHIPVDKSMEISLLVSEVKDIESALSAAENDGNKRGIRALANKLAKRREKLIFLNKSQKDNVVTFNDMGIDYLAVDEVHEFKNLEYSSAMNRVAGMGNPIGSQKAFDLYMKINSMRNEYGKDMGVAFATGTPVSNSLVEMYALMRYMNPQGLAERKLHSFDAWVKSYASIENRIEYTATQKLKERTVMSNFNNIPEMMQLYRQFSDIVLKKDLDQMYADQIIEHNQRTGESLSTEFPVPKVKEGGRVLNIAPPNAAQIEYMDYLVERALAIETDMKNKEFDPKIDNLLWIYSDAKKAALDARIADPSAEDSDQNKVNRTVKEALRLYDKWDEDKGTQLIFCDLSTPSKIAKKQSNDLIKHACEILKHTNDDPIHAVLANLNYQDKWSYLKSRAMVELESGDIDDRRRETIEVMISNVDGDMGAFITADTGFSAYDDIKRKLIAKGIPENEIQFIHDYSKAQDKKELFDQVNLGKVRILLGSTMKMGAGTNAQERLVALHHVDSSMHNRPSDIEQREGRIVRQGNSLYMRDPENFEVEIIAYSTERTFDSVAWQTLARKAEMLEGFRTGLRKIEENHSDSASYLEFMAETTGNPIFREKIKLEGEIEELEAEGRRIHSQLSSAKYLMERDADKTALFEQKLNERQSAIEMINAKPFMTFNGVTYKKDYHEVLGVELDAYNLEIKQYEMDMVDYRKSREAWESKKKDDRGAAPIKPVMPDNPLSFNSKRMDRSEQMQFVREVYAVVTDENRRGTALFRSGELGFEVVREYSPKDNRMRFEIFDDTGVHSYNAFNMIGIMALPKKLIELSSEPAFRESLVEEEKRFNTYKLQVDAARRLIESVKFDGAEVLESKKARYAEIQVVVSEIEDAERERRLNSGNKYIEMDTKRFSNRRKPRSIIMQRIEDEIEMAYDEPEKSYFDF